MNTQTLAEQFTPKQLTTIEADPQVLKLRYSPNGNTLVAACCDARIRRWDVTEDQWRELGALAGHHGWTQAIAFSADGQTLYSGDSWGELRAWALGADEPQPRWTVTQAHDGWLREMSLSPDGKTLATCGADQTIRLWSTADGSPQGTLKDRDNEDLYVVRYSPDGTMLVAGDRKGFVWQWEVASGKLVRKLDASLLYKYDRIQDVGGVFSLAFDAQGEQLAVGGNKPKNGATIQGIPTLLLFNFATGEVAHTHELGAQNDCDVMDIHLHAAGFFLAAISGGPGQGKVVLMRPGDEAPFFTETKIANVHSLAMHPSGKRFVVSGTNKGSNGNGRRLDKEGAYPNNTSPIHLFALGE